MHIIGELKSLIWLIAKTVLIAVTTVLVAAAAPIIIAILPQVLLALNPHQSLGSLAQIFFWLTPLAVSLWMAALCNFHSIRCYIREGKINGSYNNTWMKDHGGFWHTNFKSTGYMLLGFFGSFVCEFAFLTAFGHVSGLVQYRLWFALFPFVSFAPVIVLLLKRWNYTETSVLKGNGFYSDPELEADILRVAAQHRAARVA